MAKYMPMKSNEDVLVFGNSKVNYYPKMVKRTEEEYKLAFRKNDSKSWGNNIQGQTSNIIKRKSAEEQWYKMPTNILNFPKESIRDGSKHPTQKPVALFQYLIETYTLPGQIVLDNCAGSGTTAIACITTSRKYILIENNEDYIDMINKRLEIF
jgi:site-specific DNA-methyltransferase (adenine-specific)